MRAFSRRRLLAGAAVVALIAVAAFVVVRHIENDVPAADDAVFNIEMPRSEVRRAKELVVRFESGTCYPADKEEIAREINAPLRVQIQDRREAVVIKARFDHDYVRSISPRPRDSEAICLGVGLTFTRRIVLPRPIGKRALLNGGFIHRGAMPRVLVRSLVKEHNALWSSRIKRLRYMGINREGHRLEPGESP